MRSRAVGWCVLFSILLSASGCLSLPEPKPQELVAAGIVLDLSTPGASTQRCAEAATRIRALVRGATVRRLDVVVVGTGDRASGGEPIVLVRWRAWAPSTSLFEHPDERDEATEAWVTDVQSDCQRAIRQRDSSPIYFAAMRAAESIKAHCAELETAHARCGARVLYIHSDLRETTEHHITSAIAAMSKALQEDRSIVRLPPVPGITTAGLDAHVCGTAGTALSAGQRLVEPAVLVRVWSTVLNVGADAFDATCPSEAPARRKTVPQ